MNISTNRNTNEHITHNKHITKKGSISLYLIKDNVVSNVIVENYKGKCMRSAHYKII